MTILREQPGIGVPEAANLLGVLQGTIRNDLKSLAGTGQVRRVRGGGVILDESRDRTPIFTTRVMTHPHAKESITEAAASLVHDNDSLMLDSSTTAYYLACCLRDRRDLTVITNGIESARELAKNPSNTVILPGGVLRVDGMATSMPMGEQFLGNYRIKTAFISCSGFTPDGGLTEVDIFEADNKRRMIATSGATIALIDSSKFGRMDLTVFARTDQIDHLFTDQSLSAHWVRELRHEGVPFSLCALRAVPP